MRGLALETAVIRVDLPALGMPSKPHVGQYLELELEAFALTRPAWCLGAWRPVGRAFKAQVAKATVAALGNEHLLRPA